MLAWFTNLFSDDVQRRVATAVVTFLLTTVAALLLGRWWGKWRSGREWSRKQFMGRLIVSMNTFADGYLKIRTVFERPLQEVFFNQAAVDKVLAASNKTTEADSMLPLATDDRWFILNFVLNAVAEEYNQGLIRYDAHDDLAAGAPNRMRPVKYLLWLTCERVGPDRIRKVRAMMIRKDLLPRLPEGMPRLEQTWHADRMNTLRRAAEVYREVPDNFLTLEVYV